MESDSWSRFSAASRRHQSTLQSRFDLYLGFDDVEGGEDDFRAEFGCPFCAEDFDIVGLCCHIDEEHPVEAKNGVCPVCAARVGMDMIAFICNVLWMLNFSISKFCASLAYILNSLTKSHMQRRRRFRRGSSASQSTLSLLRKELREGNLQSLFGGSSYLSPPSSAAPDPLLSSFITNLPVADPPRESQTLDDRNMDSEASEDKPIER
ncbi:uncharacterized protein A4U43_C08F31910 [Asparagus officinalis]|nr:uncharacterized protein A4U43_C08F31910 [Asparagus officinalis]